MISGKPMPAMIAMISSVDNPSSDVGSFEDSLLGRGVNLCVCSLVGAGVLCIFEGLLLGG